MMLIFLSYKKISHYYIPIFSFCFATSIVKVFKSLSRSWFYHLGTTIKLFLHFGLSLSIVTRCFCFFEPNVTRSSNSISPCFHLIGDPLYHAYVCFSFYFFLVPQLIYVTILILVALVFGSCSYESKFFKCCKCTYLCHLSISEFMICPFSMYIWIRSFYFSWKLAKVQLYLEK